MFGSRQSGLHQYAEAIELYDTAIETSIVNNKFTSLVPDTVTVLLYRIVNGLMSGNTTLKRDIDAGIEKYKTMHSQQSIITQMHIKKLFLSQGSMKSKKKVSQSTNDGPYFTFISKLATVLTTNDPLSNIDYITIQQIIYENHIKVVVINEYSDRPILNIILILITTKRKLYEILPSVLIPTRFSGCRTMFGELLLNYTTNSCINSLAH